MSARANQVEATKEKALQLQRILRWCMVALTEPSTTPANALEVAINVVARMEGGRRDPGSAPFERLAVEEEQLPPHLVPDAAPEGVDR